MMERAERRRRRRTLNWIVVAGCGAMMLSCRSTESQHDPVTLSYVGSSTVAFFIRDAAQVLADVDFTIETGPESDGGERAILTRSADLAGIAREPGSAVARNGVASVMIGRDALAVIVGEDIEIDGLTSRDLRRIYGGEITNWSEVGGDAAPIQPLVVGEGSATRDVFQARVMNETPYVGVEVVVPDSAMVDRVAQTAGAIGFISFAFLDPGDDRVRALEIDGRAPSLYDYEYPIARPLYLLWQPGTPGVDRFVQWATSSAGQAVVRRHYPGVGVIGSVGPLAEDTAAVEELGTLVVYTPTFKVNDGDIEYFPHRPYEILRGADELVERVRNHRGVNDEHPTHVNLRPGVYRVRTRDERGEPLEFYATIRPGLTTELRLEEVE